MTQPERQVSGAVCEPATPPAAGPPRLPPIDPSAPISRPWEALFQKWLPAAQRQCLDRPPSQPPSSNGAGGEGARRLFTHILNDTALQLPTVPFQALSFVDSELDEPQREAVRRALGTPDLCLVQGLAGTGKSRVAAEVVTQAALRGERVLLVATHAAALDRVLETVGTRAGLSPIRCLAKTERADQLPPGMRALTFAERERQLGEQAVKSAAADVEQAEARCRRLRQDCEVFGKLAGVATESEKLHGDLGKLQDQRARLAAEVERSINEFEAAGAAGRADGFPGSLVNPWAARQQAVQRLDSQRTAAEGLRRRLGELAPAILEIGPLLEAKQHGRWWTWKWWQATFRGNALGGRLVDLETQQKQLEAELARLEEDQRRLGAEQAQTDAAYRAERSRLCEAETARRQQQSLGSAGDVEQRRAALQQQAAALLRDLDSATPRPAGVTPEAIQNSLSAARQQLANEEQRAAAARESATGLAKSMPHLPAWLASHANLVAAPLAALATDRHFGDAGNVTFDLLVLEEAHLTAEADLLRVLARAHRWVLIGQPEAKLPFSKTAPAATPRAPFQRLWEKLHCDPRRVPYAWLQQKGQWCCRLRSLSAEQRRHLECERVADCPDIELRILAQPGAEPALAEVVFPAAMSVVQAKEYIFRELQELAIQIAGHTFFWLEETERLVVRLSDGNVPETAPVQLEKGVRELVSAGQAAANGPPARSAGQTCCLEFDRSAGWDRTRAEEWLQRYLGLKDWGRTIRLHLPRRAEPAAPRARETQHR
jgi:hypothetical protein